MTRLISLILVIFLAACAATSDAPPVNNRPCDDKTDGGIGGTGVECNMIEN